MADRPLLVIRHVPWEGPHRILDAFVGVPVIEVDALAPGATLPGVDQVRGAVIMGGPMSVNDGVAHPGLDAEVQWIRAGLAADVPMLGICLGSQLIARAAGAPVAPGPRKEIGWLPVAIADPRDPVVGPLAPMTMALHWHGEAFPLPDGAAALARSAITPVQAYRLGSAWGVLFHPEADEHLVERWLAEPSMRHEAEEVLGPDAPDALRIGAQRHSAELMTRSAAGFAAFAARTAETP
jgi:GMP synthase (glutamine-hydrolysing)